MVSKRFFALFFALVFAFGAIFASTGALEVSTAHFKIVYEPECASTAQVLAEGCEDEYSRLCSFFGTDPNIVVPVYVTSKYKVLNAYYTPYPSNRIVIFDTVAGNDGLAVFPDTILYVFRHELTHAFTMNIRSGFWQFVSSVFGDGVSVSPALYAYDSLVEGVAVLSESTDGYGRMNDMRSLRILRQAKLEGRFPSWTDMAGAMDVYPSSSVPYIFGGAFLFYLYDEYGGESIGEIFRRFGRVNWFQSTASVIEDCVGVPFQKVWYGFYDSIEVPSSFVQASYVDAFGFKSRIEGLAVGSNGNVYLLDRASSAVYELELGVASREGLGSNGDAADGDDGVVDGDGGVADGDDEVGEGVPKGAAADDANCRRLFSIATYGQGLDVSPRGEIMVPYIAQGTSCVKVYDKDGHALHSYSFDDRDVRGGCFVELPSSAYVLLYTSKGQETFLELCSEGGEVVFSVALGSGATASGFVSLGDGEVVFILTSSGVDYIAVLDVAQALEGDSSLRKSPSILFAGLPNGIRLSSMSCGWDGSGRETVSFCWFPSSSFDESLDVDDVPVLGGYGEFLLDDWSIRLSYENVLGGVNHPARLGDTVAFSASMYDGDRFCSVSIEDLHLGDETALEPREMGAARPLGVQFWDSQSKGLADSIDVEEGSKPYWPILNVKRGVLFPFGVYGPLSHTNDIGLGLTWYASDPTGTVAIAASGSYTTTGPSVWANFSLWDAVDFGVGAKAILDCKTRAVDAHLFTFHAGVQLDFDIGNERYVTVEDSFYANWLHPLEGEWAVGLSNEFSATYGYGISTGLGKTDSFGYAFGVGLSGINPSLSAVLGLPRVLPFRCDGALAYNLPLRIGFTVGYSFGLSDVVFVGSAKATVLSYEIQRGVRLLGLYFRRAVLEATCSASYLAIAENFSQSLEVQAIVELSPVLGQYLTGIGVCVGAKLVWNFTDPVRIAFAFSLK